MTVEQKLNRQITSTPNRDIRPVDRDDFESRQDSVRTRRTPTIGGVRCGRWDLESCRSDGSC